ncbi:MAG: hypothetical protein ABI462_02735 [Ignavibacteria bacterium]
MVNLNSKYLFLIFLLVVIVIIPKKNYAQYDFYNFIRNSEIVSKKDFLENIDKIKESKIKIITEWIYKVNNEVREEEGSKNIYLYNSSGSMIENTNYNKEGISLGRIIYIYDDDNNLIEEKFFYNDIQETNSKYEYDDTGNLIGIVNFDKNGNIDGKEKYFYDTVENSIKVIFYRNGIVTGAHTFKYNDQQNILEFLTYSPDGKLDRNHNPELVLGVKIHFNYDSLYLKIMRTEIGHFPDGTFGKAYAHEFFKYDFNKNLVGDEVTFLNKTISNIYSYDNKDLLMEKKMLNNSKELIKITNYVYEFFE